MFKPADIKRIFANLGLVLFCPVCEAKYTVKNLKLIQSYKEVKEDSIWFYVHADCTKCRSSIMFNIDIQGPEVFSMSMITDLTASDSKKFTDLSPISIDDCITVHETLNSFDGNFVKLLAKPSRQKQV